MKIVLGFILSLFIVSCTTLPVDTLPKVEPKPPVIDQPEEECKDCEEPIVAEKPVVEEKIDKKAKSKMYPLMTWMWNIESTPSKNFSEEAVDVDLFSTPGEWILDVTKNKKKTVICYFSAGSYEAWRPDAKTFPSSIKGQKMDGWDELWLNTKDPKTLDIMKKRIELAAYKNCSGVEFDNVDGYGNKTGFGITKSDSIKFLKQLADYSHKQNLIVGLKNSPDIVPQLVNDYDFSLVEECAKYNECGEYVPFIKQNKPVFQAEYRSYSDSLCAKAKEMKFSLLFFKSLSVDGTAKACK